MRFAVLSDEFRVMSWRTQMQDYHQLQIWERSITYAVDLYRFSAGLPDAERYNLVAQLRKAATSVPLNIAEGSGCTTDGEFVRFLGYAYRSLKEVVTCLELCERLYSTGEHQLLAVLIDEGNQIHDPHADTPAQSCGPWRQLRVRLITKLMTHHSKLTTDQVL
jgi:four helix bundle protein